ncbi:MAG: ATP-binding protein, partial [Cyanobacteria bacterium J06639_1]
EAIATQVGIALTQAQAFAELESLTQRLQHVDRAQRNLIAIVGHELRTPLSTIRICLESLTDEPDMPAAMQTAMLETASGDAERMRRLVQDFLTLSKLESGQVRWQIEETALQPCVDLALSGLSRQYESERIPAIDIDLPHNLPNVLVDADMLVELLSKLLDNAAKFTPESGAIDIRASLAPTPAAAGAIEVVVADSGRGITDTQLDSIFDRFAQEEGAMQRSAGGVGLGLAICRRIVEEMGGEIWAESPGVDGGSEFHFTLPVVGDLSSFRTDELAG